MKKSFLLISALLSLVLTRAWAAGGPDAYGYTWKSSTDPGGPAYNWVNIVGRPGTATVSGLADDNAAPLQISMGMSFHYYWNDYTKIKVGSNGWLSFDNPSNVASCFPTIPTTGGAADNLLAALMCDLNFTGAGNPGVVYYWTNANDSFIVTYQNVPYWNPAAPGWQGGNTFQIILDKGDSSICYQYQTLGAGFQANLGCNDITVGIENSTGSIGLQVYADAVPPATYAIKFYYPQTVLIAVQDIYPKWSQNNKSAGYFYPRATPLALKTTIRNGGNTATTASTSVLEEVLNSTLASFYNQSGTVYSLNASEDTLLNWSPSVTLNTAGNYFARTTTANAQDVNMTNNIVTTEIGVVDICQPTALLSYTTGATNTGSVNWNGGANDDGAAVYLTPPVNGGYTIQNIQFFTASNAGNNAIMSVYDDDGLLGAPGTLLYTTTVASGSIAIGGWTTVATNITLPDGGFYVAWFQGGTSIFIGTETTAPISKRNYEILDGAWSEYRENTTQDFMIRATVGNYSSAPVADWSNTTSSLAASFTDNSIYPVSWAWDFGDGQTSTLQNPSHSYAAGGTYQVCLTVTGACGTDSVCHSVTVSCGAPTASYTYNGAGLAYNFTDQTLPGPSGWLWDFGDGQTSTQQSPTHTYAAPGNYTVCLTVTDSCGTDSTCQNLSVVCPLPSALFNVGTTGLDANFTDQSTTNPTSWSWDFGDGQTSTQQNPTHTYAAPGTYTVCLVATNSCGWDSLCQSVTVTCAAPSAGFTFNVNGTGDTYSFSDASSGTPASWAWTFGDGGTSTQQNPSHTYTADGTYQVCLTITDACGTDSTCQTLTVVIIANAVGINPVWDIFPNPGKDFVQVQAQGLPLGMLHLRVMDLTGKEVLRWTSEISGGTLAQSLNLSTLPNGMYLIELRTEKGSSVKRWVKQ